MLIYNYYGFKNSTVNHIPKAVSWKFHMVAISNSKSSSSLVPMRNLEDNLKNNEKKKSFTSGRLQKDFCLVFILCLSVICDFSYYIQMLIRS